MASVTKTLMTADEFFEWANRPERDGKLYELDRGEVVEMPPPGEVHGTVCSWVAFRLWQFALQRGKGRVCSNDTGLLVERDPDTLRGPDVMFFDEPANLDALSTRYATAIPRLVVEVFSPSDQMSKVNRRMGQYLKRGVPLVWLVDPEVRVVTVYRIDRYPQTHEEAEELTGEEVLPDLRLRVAELFTMSAQASQP